METQAHKETTIKVMVKFMAAEEPFKEDDAPGSQTVGELKARVLHAFGLKEGSTSEGTTITYTLFHDGQPLENLSQTLGEIAGDKRTLDFTLSQRITQGRGVSELNFDEDFEKVLCLEEATRWALHRGDAPLEVGAAMSPSSQPKEVFYPRLLWRSYPGDPPSLKFRDLPTKRIDLSRAWPLVRGFRPQSLDACVNWCEEGFALHAEWRGDPNLRWEGRGNVLLKVLRILQDELDRFFQGRYHA